MGGRTDLLSGLVARNREVPPSFEPRLYRTKIPTWPPWLIHQQLQERQNDTEQKNSIDMTENTAHKGGGKDK